MRILKHVFDNNRRWADGVRSADPEFFQRLSRQQFPEYLWIGCSDSRVPANQIVNLAPGEVFVHRNVANVVVHSDLNCLSVMQFAIDVLKVRHVIVCGHYGCGGVKAALNDERHGLVDNWLHHVKDVHAEHRARFEGVEDPEARVNLLCELNVIEQVMHVCTTTIVQDAWARGQDVDVHGWIYGLDDGYLRDLGMTVAAAAEVEPAYRAAMASRGG